MALTATTLSSAVGQTDVSIVVASATGAAAGTFVLIDQEVMKIVQTYTGGTTIGVVRGQDGSAQVAHKTSAKALFFLASDQTGPSAQTGVQWPIGARPRIVQSYSASGAISLPTPGSDLVVILNGTGALAMTLAVPTADMDGTFLTVSGNGKAAHTVTVASGLGNVGGTADVFTFAAAQAQAIQIIACGGFWNGIGMNTAVAGAGATINGVGLG